jgi:hypothetical protein
MLTALPVFYLGVSEKVASQTVGILDHETPAYLQFGSPSYSVAEDQTNAVISVVRTGEFRETVSVEYSTEQGTAEAEADFEPQRGTLLIPAGVGYTEFLVPVHLDEAEEGPETVELVLSRPSSNGLIVQGRSLLTIVESASPPAPERLRLDIAADGAGRILLSWSTNAAGCVLQKKEDMASAAWSDVSSAPEVSEGRCTVVLDQKEGSFFFRLRER